MKWRNEVFVYVFVTTHGEGSFRGDTTKFLQTCWEDQISNSTWMWRQGKACWLLTLPICGFLLELASPITVCLQRKKFPYLTWKLILLCLEHEPNSNFLKPSVDTVKGFRPASAGFFVGPRGALPYLAYTGMCRWKGYSFQGLGPFGNGSLSKSMKTCDERCTFAMPIIFSQITISTILVWKIT